MAKQEFDKLPMKMNEYFNAKTGAAAAVETFPALHPVHGRTRLGSSAGTVYCLMT